MVHIENSIEVLMLSVSQYCRNVTRALLPNYFSDKDDGGGGRVGGGGGCGGIQLVPKDLHCQGIICGARDTNNKHYTYMHITMYAHTANVHTVVYTLLWQCYQ